MRKRKKQTAESHECTEGHELIARYMGGDSDDELTRALLLHAQSCRKCAGLLRSLKRLVHYCQLEPNCEMPVTVRKDLWATIRRDLSGQDAECGECTRLHELIAEYAGGELDEKPTRELMRHLQSCPKCARLLRSLRQLDRIIKELRPVPEIPKRVHNSLWIRVRQL
jgi:hypothetical protein